MTDPVALRVPDLAAYLDAGADIDRIASLRRADVVGRPIGSRGFIERLERQSGRALAPLRRGPRLRVECEEGLLS